MNRSFVLVALLIASQATAAKELEKVDTAATWQNAPASEQAAFVIAFGKEHSISKKSDLRFLQNCMRELAKDSPQNAESPTIDSLANACLPLLRD